jgi:hypothetical protein
MARLFQNKLSIYGDEFKFNFFALTDPNNYFFHFHPREITQDNQNLDKYPALVIIFLLFGLYYLPKNPDKNFIIFLCSALLINLSLLKSFDRVDLSLYLFISLIIIWGFQEFNKLKTPYISLGLYLFIIFGLIEYLSILLRYSMGVL